MSVSEIPTHVVAALRDAEVGLECSSRLGTICVKVWHDGKVDE